MSSGKKRPGDKICDICGNIGFVEEIVTCCACKLASEHIYCMQTQEYVDPEEWQCEKCLASILEVDEVIKTNILEKQEVFYTPVSKLKTIQIQDQEYFGLSSEGSSNQIKFGKMKQKDKDLPAQDGSLKIPLSVQVRFSVAPASTVKHVSRMLSFKPKETGKVKFIPAEEIAQLTSGVKARESNTCRSLVVSLNRTHFVNGAPSSISQRTWTNKPSSSRAYRSFYQPGKEHLDAKVDCSPSSHKIMSGNCSNGKKVKIQEKRDPVQKASPVLCQKDRLRRSPCADISGCSIPTGFISDWNTSTLNNDAGQRRREVDKDLALATPTKGEPPKKRDHVQLSGMPSTSSKTTGQECVNSTLLCSNDETREPANDTRQKAVAQSSGEYHLNPKLKPGAANKDHNALHNEAAVAVPSTGNSGNISCPEIQPKGGRCQDTGSSMTFLVHQQHKFPNYPTAEVRWKATFEILDFEIKFYIGMQAHCPQNLSIKVYDMLQQMPRELKLKVVRRADVWPRIFQSDPPNTRDIALYLFPELQRSKEEYFHLLDRIDSGDFAMRSCIGDVEFLVFTSKQLPLDSQRIANEVYSWGVFRHVKRVELCQQNPADVPSSVPLVIAAGNTSSQPNVLLEGNSDEVDMEVDMEDGKETGIVDVPVPRVLPPPGFSTPAFQNENHGKRPLVKFAMEKAVHQSISNVLTGFTRLPSLKLSGSSSGTIHEDPALSSKKASGPGMSLSGGDGHANTLKACAAMQQHQVDPYMSTPLIWHHNSPSNHSNCIVEKAKGSASIGIHDSAKGREPSDGTGKMHFMHKKHLFSSAKEQGCTLREKSKHDIAGPSSEKKFSSIPSLEKKSSHVFKGLDSENQRPSPQTRTGGVGQPITTPPVSNSAKKFSPTSSADVSKRLHLQNSRGSPQTGTAEQLKTAEHASDSGKKLLLMPASDKRSYDVVKRFDSRSPRGSAQRGSAMRPGSTQLASDSEKRLSSAPPLENRSNDNLKRLDSEIPRGSPQTGTVVRPISTQLTSASERKFSSTQTSEKKRSYDSFKSLDCGNLRGAPQTGVDGQPISTQLASASEKKFKSIPSLEKKKSFNVFQWLDSEKPAGSPRTGIAAHPMSTQCPGSAKIVLQAQSSADEAVAKDSHQNTSFKTKGAQGSSVANQGEERNKETDGREANGDESGTDRLHKKSKIVPDKWHLRESDEHNMGNEDTLNPLVGHASLVPASYKIPSTGPGGHRRMGGVREAQVVAHLIQKEVVENQNESNPKEKQPFPLGYESPLPRLPLISDNVALPLFPEKAETIGDHTIERWSSGLDLELEMSLSRPRYVQDGNAWISAGSRGRLKKDSCSDELRLSLTHP